MPKIGFLRRFLLSCLIPNSATAAAAATKSSTAQAKKRISTSLRDDLDDDNQKLDSQRNQDGDQDSSSSAEEVTSVATAASLYLAPPRPSKTMVTGTIFGHRHGHVWFCIQHERLKTKPSLLLEFSMPTHVLVQEMQCGVVRIALECHGSPESELGRCPLHSVPLWTMYCNGRKLGFANWRKPTPEIRRMLKTMQSISFGAGVIPVRLGSGSEGKEGSDLTYMRANYECVIGGPNSESFHLINPDEAGQELSVFLLRSFP